MVLVRPTNRWLGRSQRIPRGRKITRQGNSPIEVTEQEAIYLTANFLAFMVDRETLGSSGEASTVEVTTSEATTTKAIASDPVGSEEGDTVSEESDKDVVTSDLSGVAEIALQYLIESDAETIAAQIRGIGRKTADELKAVESLDWKTVEQILSDRQVKALLEFVRSLEQDGGTQVNQ